MSIWYQHKKLSPVLLESGRADTIGKYLVKDGGGHVAPRVLRAPKEASSVRSFGRDSRGPKASRRRVSTKVCVGTSRAPSKRQQGPGLTETAVKPGMLSTPGCPCADQSGEGPLTPAPSKQVPSDAQRHWAPQPRRLSKGVQSIPSSLLFYLKLP